MIARRLEWLQARTSVERWTEEVWLLKEERRRVEAWYRYQLAELQKRTEIEIPLFSARVVRGRLALSQGLKHQLESDLLKVPSV